MSDLNTNITDRIPARQPIDTTEVFDLADLPAPISDVITLTAGHYSIRAAVDLGINSLKFDTAAGNIVIDTPDGGISSLTSSTTNAFLEVTQGADVRLQNIDIFLDGVAAQLFDVTIDGTFFVLDVAVTFTGGGATGVGSVTALAIDFTLLQLTNIRNGMTLTTTAFIYADSFALTDFAGTGDFITFINRLPSLVTSVRGSGFILASTQDLFNISPAIEGVINIESSRLTGGQNYFALGTTGPISAFADAAFASESITSVSSGTGGAARFNFTAPPTLFVNQEVVIVGYTTNTAYNVTGVITATGAGFFEVVNKATGAVVPFGTDEAGGSFTSATVTVSDTAHGLAEGTAVLIENTINYNGGATIYNALTNSFQINRTFTITETGQWNTGSLDETSKFVNAQNNGAQKDSMTIGSMVVGGNATATTINTQNVFEDMDLGSGAVEAGNNERFIVTDGVTGEIRYEGLNSSVFNIVGLIAASSSGGGQRFNFRALKNGSELPSPDNVDVPIEVGNNLSATALEWGLTLDPGDLFRLQVANADGTSNITIDTFKLTIS